MNFIQKHIKPILSDKKPDYLLLILSCSLFIIGMIFSYSLSIFTVDYFDYGQFHFLLRQAFIGVFAIAIMFFFAHIRPEVLLEQYKIGWLLFGVFMLLMAVMPFLPSFMVTQSGGANRWIRLPGFSLSPVEFFKIGFIYFLAFSFHRKFTNLHKISFKQEVKMLLPYAVVFSIVVFLIAFLQKDLGQVVLLGTVLFVMLIFANRSAKIFMTIISTAIFGVITLIISAPHRINRFQSWWSSVQDSILAIFPSDIANSLRVEDFPEPYQVSNSLNAMYHGGWFGVDLSNGALKLGFLSEVHTDFVLAGITEEIGLIGLFFIITLFFIVIMRILRISRRLVNAQYHLFTLGIAIMLFIAFIINAYGVSGIIPIKGIAVPFLSYGGSGILSLGIAIGLVLSISTQMITDEELKNQTTEDEKEKVNIVES